MPFVVLFGHGQCHLAKLSAFRLTPSSVNAIVYLPNLPRAIGYEPGLDIPRMFAALLLITVTGVALFGLMVGLDRILLGHWHDSAVKTER